MQTEVPAPAGSEALMTGMAMFVTVMLAIGIGLSLLPRGYSAEKATRPDGQHSQPRGTSQPTTSEAAGVAGGSGGTDVIRPRTDNWPQRREQAAYDPDEFLYPDIRWRVCGPVMWRDRGDSSIPDAHQQAATALQMLSDATGLEFRYGGDFDGTIASLGELDQNTIYISWETEEETPGLSGFTAGRGGPISASVAGSDPVFVSGTAVVDSSQGLEHGFTNGASEGGVLLHELGHAIGLDHSDDQSRIMFPTTQYDLTAAYQPGDLTVLQAAVDTHGCSDQNHG